MGLIAAARTPVKELEARLGVKLLSPEDEEDIDTLGGLVFAIVGRVPARGELCGTNPALSSKCSMRTLGA